jgi:DNA-binding NarL/FixJ family response regulator
LKHLPKEAKTDMAIFLKQSLEQIDQLMKIILSVNKGEYILDPALEDPGLSKANDDLFLKELTKRELEILNLIAEGYSNSAMASILYIDIKTVRHHINNIYSKLKTEEDFKLKHPRVRATRRYLAMKGKV